MNDMNEADSPNGPDFQIIVDPDIDPGKLDERNRPVIKEILLSSWEVLRRQPGIVEAPISLAGRLLSDR